MPGIDEKTMDEQMSASDPNAKILVGRVVLNLQTLVVGKVDRVFSGEPGDRYVDKADYAIDEPVVLFETGDALLLRAGKDFVPLTKAQFEFYEATQAGFSGVVAISAQAFAKAGETPDFALKLVKSALRLQLARLSAA